MGNLERPIFDMLNHLLLWLVVLVLLDSKNKVGLSVNVKEAVT